MHLTPEVGDPVNPVLLEEDALGMTPNVVLPEPLTDEEDAGDDPLRTYLREIHEVNLLTAADERMLACRMEEMIALDEVWHELREAHDGLPPTGLDTAIRLYERVHARRVLAQVLARLEDMDDAALLLQNANVRNRLDFVPDAELGSAVSAAAGLDNGATQAYILRFSIDTRLIPPDLYALLDGVSVHALPDAESVRATLLDRDCEDRLSEFFEDMHDGGERA